MALSTSAVKALMTACASADLGNEVATAINKGEKALDIQEGLYGIAAVIVATNVSTTIDFAALAVGDKIIQIPATPGNADYLAAVATAGTLPEAAVVGDLYLVLRAFTVPTATAIKF